MSRDGVFVVLGASGHIGSSVARTLREHGHEVVAVVHNASKAGELRAIGAEIAEVDVLDTQALRAVLRRGQRAFLLNPPAPTTKDTDVEENRTAISIADAVGGSGLEKVLVQSTYGAQPGEAIGDLSVLWNFERRVGSAAVPMAINRGAYYFTNLRGLLEGARTGTVTTTFPADRKIPMVAPADLGVAAALRLAGPLEDTGIKYIEGPDRYSFDDVAGAFAQALGRTVNVRTIDRANWEPSFRKAGFSPAAARAFARMTAASLDGFDMPDGPQRGPTTLLAYISALVDAAP